MAVIKLSDFYPPDAELMEGEWITLDGGLECLIAKAQNSNFQRKLEQLNNQWEKKGKTVPPAKKRKNYYIAVAETVWLKFKGECEVEVEDGDNLVVKSSPDNHLIILKTYPNIFSEITDHATDMQEAEDRARERQGKD